MGAGRPAAGGGGATLGPPAEGAMALTGEQRSGGLMFAPDVAEVDRQVVLGAVARARPEARRLIDLVDGIVVVDVVLTPQGAAGVTRFDGRPPLHVDLNLGLVARSLGQLGTDRLVLHELGHVIDFVLTPPELDERLDAAIPAGFGCEGGLAGGCAQRRERFAETFAKWAMRGAGLDLSIGYKVPPPPSLDDWGRPLAALDR
jgi:hypothetical protein